MSTPAADLAACVAWLAQWRRPLLVTHERPDGDAIGALTATWYLLQAMGAQPSAYVTEAIPETYLPFAPPGTLVGGALDPATYDAIICLDCARLERNAIPKNWQAQSIPLPMANLDHHVDNPKYGQYALVAPQCSATCELLTELARHLARPLPQAALDALLMGIVFDTGGFRFSNTSAATLALSAWLLEQKADLARVNHYLFFDVPFKRLLLQAEVIQQVRFACDGRLAWFSVTKELMARHQMGAGDIEELVDIVRGVRGTDLVARIQEVAEGIRFSVRARDARWPAIKIAHRLGGGGHQMAAGAMLKGATIAEAEAVLVKYAEELFHG